MAGLPQWLAAMARLAGAALVLAAVLPCLTDSGSTPAALHAAGGGASLPAGGARSLHPLLLPLLMTR